jgi:hypothetical protein
MPRIKLVTFDRAPTKLPGVRGGDLTTLDLDQPAAALFGWRVMLRGASFFMVSPPGWNHSNATSPMRRDDKGPATVLEFPRSNIFIQWEATAEELEACMKMTRWDGPVLGPAKPVEETVLVPIPPNEIGDA